jgi:hypothetical protein
VNKFDFFITEYLRENKEVALEKIGLIKTLSFSNTDTQAASVEFTFNKKITTSPQLINYIAEKVGKNKNLIASDLESHFSQVREFINIGKSYEIPLVGFIKANRTGMYEFLPYSEAAKPVRTGPQPVKDRPSKNNRSVIQLISFLIVIAILAGLGWQAYEFFIQRSNNNAKVQPAVQDTVVADTVKHIDSAAIQQPVTYSQDDTAVIRYIFETTASALRAHTRTEQLRNFGNNAGYDSNVTNSVTYYNLYVEKPTKIADTLRIKDSISKFFLKDVKLQIVTPK